MTFTLINSYLILINPVGILAEGYTNHPVCVLYYLTSETTSLHYLDKLSIEGKRYEVKQTSEKMKQWKLSFFYT